MEISKDQFLAWRDNPVTKRVATVLKHRIEEQRDKLAAGGAFDPENPFISHASTARTLGKIEGLEELLMTRYDDIGLVFDVEEEI
jgi:hypothetical protein